jgi:ubiquinone/menaquinone biosynthesis C-methylase UbiE
MSEVGQPVNVTNWKDPSRWMTITWKGAGVMHSSARHRHGGTGSDTETIGLTMRGGWRYDLHGWFLDTCVFRGQGRVLRQRTLRVADLHAGDSVLDVGCGTGTLALEAARPVGRSGRVCGIDPSSEQIARARAKAARRRVPVEFQSGVIEQLPFADVTFDVVLSTLMMHHLPAPTKRQGLLEIIRVLKPGGRLVIADLTRNQDRTGQAARFHAGGSRLEDLVALVQDVGFQRLETEEVAPARHSAFPGAGILRGYKR